jgi:hypothetical protein
VKTANFADFMRQRLQHLNGVTDESLIDMEMKRAFIEFVRSDIPLEAHMRQLIAGDLECFYFPKLRQKQTTRSLAKAYVSQDAINFIAAKNRAAGKPKPIGAAEDDVAAMFGISVEAMKQNIKRTKRSLICQWQAPAFRSFWTLILSGWEANRAAIAPTSNGGRYG